MRQYLRLLLCSSVLFALVFSACRNEPKLPVNNWDKTVSVRLPGDPKSMYFLEAADGESIQILYQIFLPLADFDPVTYELTPVLIKEVPKITEITEGENNGLVSYEYEIREEATWADGSPVTGKDYLFTIKAMHNPHKRSGYASQLKRVKQITVDENNPKKFTIYSTPYMMGRAGYSNMNLLPEYLYDPKGILANYTWTDLRDNEKLIEKEDLKELANAFSSPKYLRSPEILQGSGPYKLSEWTTGQQLVLTKRANWWGESLAKDNKSLSAFPEKIIYKIIPDANAAMSLMTNGELDVFTKMNWTTFLNQKEKADFTDKYNFYNPELFGIRMMFYNTVKEKLADKKVRRAISHLYPTKEIDNTVFYGSPTPVHSPVNPNVGAYNTDLKLIDLDVEKAKQLLAESGWKDTNNNGIVDKEIDGEQVELTIELAYAVGNKDYPDVVTIFRNAAIKAGVDIQPKGHESQSFKEEVLGRKFEMVFLGMGGYPFNTDPEMRWHSSGRLNHSSFGTAESDALIKEIKGTINVDKQNELFKKLYALIYEEQPCLFIGVDKDRIIVSKKFGNIDATGLSPGFKVNRLNGNAVIAVTSSNN